MNYFALDVETANADYSSICQIGIVHIQDGQILDRWSSLINPETYFDPFNISIHGITEEDIKSAPTFDKIYNVIAEKATNQITVHHMPFDKIAVTRACLEYNLEILQPKWLDSAKIARRTWEQFAYRGYGLRNIANYLGIEFGHHDALEDAIAAAHIVYEACEQTQLTVEDWLTRVEQPIFKYKGGSTSVKLEGNPEGALYGEKLVFTGALSLPRNNAAKIAADLGCSVGNTVSKKTSILVVGTQDMNKLSGYEKSSKHRKAEELIQMGASIKILSEKDFIEMCNNENEELSLLAPKPETESKKNIKQAQLIEQSSMPVNNFLKNDVNDEINTDWNGFTKEQEAVLFKAGQEYRKLLDSIKDCSHEEKRALSIDFKTLIQNVRKYHKQFDITSFENNEIEIIDTIELEIEEIQDDLYALMKNKISLAEFFEAIDNCIENIQSDIEDQIFQKPINNYSKATLDELKKIKQIILTSTQNG